MLFVLPDRERDILKLDRLFGRSGESDDFQSDLAGLQQQVLKQRSLTKEELMKWQNNFYSEHLKEPSEQDYEENNKINELKIYWECKSLLNDWSIYL